MALPQFIKPAVVAAVTSPRLRALGRWWAEQVRRLLGRPHRVIAWLRDGDPYAPLLAQVLPGLAQDHGVVLEVRLLQARDPQMFPAAAALDAWAALDAARLAAYWGLESPETHSLAAALGDLPVVGSPAENDARYARSGHYLGAMLEYGGEWYWGLDRLCHLQARLRGLGLGAQVPDRCPPPPACPTRPAGAPTDDRPLVMYWSARSPYSYLALDGAQALAQHFGRRLEIRPVLPMVMRGLAVPFRKRLYIVRDAKREAERLGLPFGRFYDPVGPGVERCYAVFAHLALGGGDTFGWCRVFARMVWSEGVNAASDAGLRRIADAAGLDWAGVSAALEQDDWRAQVELYRTELLGLGLWGVPSFAFGDTATWGQDRLWQLWAALEEGR